LVGDLSDLATCGGGDFDNFNAFFNGDFTGDFTGDFDEDFNDVVSIGVRCSGEEKIDFSRIVPPAIALEALEHWGIVSLLSLPDASGTNGSRRFSLPDDPASAVLWSVVLLMAPFRFRPSAWLVSRDGNKQDDTRLLFLFASLVGSSLHTSCLKT